MGNASSKGGGSKGRSIIEIPSTVQKDLEKLSIIANQILSSGALYDFNNLARPGVCGDYAVFLKKDIEKKLLSFTTTVDICGSKQRMELMYQNPRKMISNDATRKAVCSSLATSMIRLASTVVACLASIQVGTPGQRSTALQRGGHIQQVRAWLIAQGYISAEDEKRTAGEPIEIRTPGSGARAIQFKMTFRESEDILTHATITASGTPAGQLPMPAGSLKMDFLNPIRVPGTNVDVLPVRVVDSTNLPWLVGILHKGYFKSLIESNQPMPILDFIELFFRKTQGAVQKTSIVQESREQLGAANEIFKQFRRIQNPDILLRPLAPFLQAYLGAYPGIGLAPGGIAPGIAPGGLGPGIAPGGGLGLGGPYPPAFPPGAYQQFPAGPYQQAVYQGQGQGIFQAGYQARFDQQPTIQLRPPSMDATLQYEIPLVTAKSISDSFKYFQESITEGTSPAITRAQALRRSEFEDRTILSGVCRDDYWSRPTLGKIYPWATLQFLSVKKWENLTATPVKPEAEIFEPEWLEFLRTLTEDIYPASSSSGLPTLERQGGSPLLNNMRFKDVKKVAVCASTDEPRVDYTAVQKGILQLQGLYDAHVKAMWGILNNLVVVIADPETRTESVKLHPAALRGDSTEAYVDAWAAKARKQLKDFYLNVERIYAGAVKELVKA